MSVSGFSVCLWVVGSHTWFCKKYNVLCIPTVSGHTVVVSFQSGCSVQCLKVKCYWHILNKKRKIYSHINILTSFATLVKSIIALLVFNDYISADLSRTE